ncbi:MFS transporter [Leucobacter zeae]|nr:MFS transporter [Leucobacter zeae]
MSAARGGVEFQIVPHPSPTPPASAVPNPRPWLLLFIAVCLVAANLRMTITGVGPLLEDISEGLGVPVAALGALGSIPLITWAAISPLAHVLSERLGIERAIGWSLVVLAAGTAWRSFPGSAVNLWAGTVIIGAGLAICNVLIPAIIKQDFPTRLPFVMGAYTAILSASASLSAGFAVPISDIDTGSGPLGWRFALLASGIAIPFGLVAWIAATWGSAKRRAAETAALDAGSDAARAASDPASASSDDGTSNSGRRIWRDPVAWLVACYMGTQSLNFYVLSTWLAPFLTSLGYPPAAAGLALMAFQALGIVGSLAAPSLMQSRVSRWAPALLPVLGLIAWIGMPILPGAMPIWIVCGGLVCGAQLTVSVTLMAVRARTRSAASALSGMSQSVGYLIAATGPILFGLLHGLTGSWGLAFAFVCAVTATQLAIGAAVGRPRFVLDR